MLQNKYANGGGDPVTTATHTLNNAEKTAKFLTAARTAADETFALKTLASQLANATNSLGLFASALLRRLLIVVAHLHFAENTFALHLLLESAERLVNVVVADKYLHVNPVPLVSCYADLRSLKRFIAAKI